LAPIAAAAAAAAIDPLRRRRRWVRRAPLRKGRAAGAFIVVARADLLPLRTSQVPAPSLVDGSPVPRWIGAIKRIDLR